MCLGVFVSFWFSVPFGKHSSFPVSLQFTLHSQLEAQISNFLLHAPTCDYISPSSCDRPSLQIPAEMTQEHNEIQIFKLVYLFLFNVVWFFSLRIIYLWQYVRFEIQMSNLKTVEKELIRKCYISKRNIFERSFWSMKRGMMVKSIWVGILPTETWDLHSMPLLGRAQEE